jgi:hypothetical protein
MHLLKNVIITTNKTNNNTFDIYLGTALQWEKLSTENIHDTVNYGQSQR